MAARKPKFLKGTYFDYPTVFLVIFLMLFGLMMVYSASSYVATSEYGDGAYYLKRQAIFALLGVFAMFLLSLYRYQRFARFAVALMIIELILLIVVFAIGTSKNGSTRWLYIGPIGFQPSELAKFVLIIYMAAICTDRPGYMKSLLGTVEIFIFPVLLIAAIAIENLSTAIICAGIVVCIWIVATPKLRYLGLMAILGVMAFAVLVLSKGYRGNRFEAWLNPETSDNGYQTMQALYAIGSGGIFGRGLGQSIQKMGYIPFAQNDMIFSVICEELGLIGGIGLIVVFVMLLWRLRFIAEGAPDRFGSLLVTGVLAHVAIQVLINVSVVTNVIPNTGVPLPFISYGGSSLLFLFFEMGLVLSVSRQIQPVSMTDEAV